MCVLSGGECVPRMTGGVSPFTSWGLTDLIGRPRPRVGLGVRNMSRTLNLRQNVCQSWSGWPSHSRLGTATSIASHGGPAGPGRSRWTGWATWPGSFRSSRNGTRSVGPRDSGRTVFFPVGTDRPARRRPAALDRPGLSPVPFHGPTRLGRACVAYLFQGSPASLRSQPLPCTIV